MKCLQLCALVPLVALLGSGCATTARVQSSSMQQQDNARGVKLSVLAKATDARENASDQVGRHTISVFMIPGPGVFSGGGHLDDAVGQVAIKGLREAGYTVSVVNDIAESGGPTLGIQMDMIRNYSFTWLYPLGLTFGKTQLSPVLFGSDGSVLWQGKATGSGFCPSLLYICGFTTAIKSEMTGAMKEIVTQLGSQEFRAALTSR